MWKKSKGNKCTVHTKRICSRGGRVGVGRTEIQSHTPHLNRRENTIEVGGLTPERKGKGNYRKPVFGVAVGDRGRVKRRRKSAGVGMFKQLLRSLRR